MYPQRLSIVHVAYYTTFQAAMSDLEIMDAIKETQAKLDNKLAEFKSEIRESQEKGATSAVRKAREPPTFRKKAHQEQHKFNEKIDNRAMNRSVEMCLSCYNNAWQ